MSEKFKIILINILLIFFILAIGEFVSFNLLRKQVGWPIPYGSMDYLDDKSVNMRSVEIGSSSKKPILIFGCSFAYGHELENEDTISYKLSRLTNRTVVNRAVQGEGPAFIYRQLSQKNLTNDIKNKLNNQCPQYILYIYFCGHEGRNFQYMGMDGRNFTECYVVDENNNLVRRQVPKFLRPFHTSAIIKILCQTLAEYKIENVPIVKATFVKTMTEICKQIDENFPDSKFVVVVMPSEQEALSEFEINKVSELTSAWKDIIDTVGQDKITFIDVVKEAPIVKNKEYWLENDKTHPSAKMWDVVANLLIKDLKL